MGKRVKAGRMGDSAIAVAYLRVSTDDQRLGNDAQRAAIEVWATREGVQVVAWHADQGVSGANELAKRPALGAALAGLRGHDAGLLVVARRDRLARDVVVASTVERLARQSGARIVSADGLANGDGPGEQFMRRIDDARSEYERALISARTKAALGVKRARGELTGSAPFGSRVGPDGRTLEPCPAESAIVETIHSLRAEPLSLPLRAIVAELSSRGIVSPRSGRPLQLAQVHRIAARIAG